MVLPMIAEMIAREKRPEHGVIVALRAVTIAIAASRLTMRQKRAEIKKLQRAQERRRNPKEQEVGERYLEQMMHEIKNERHAEQLLPSYVRAHEVPIPTPKAGMLAVVIIGIIFVASVRVMFMMLALQSRKREECIKQNTKRAEEAIHALVARRDKSVHAVMRSNEQAGVKKGLQQHGKRNAPRRKFRHVEVQQRHEAHGPDCHKEQRDEYPGVTRIGKIVKGMVDHIYVHEKWAADLLGNLLKPLPLCKPGFRAEIFSP